MKIVIKLILLSILLINTSFAGGDYISFLEDKNELRLLKDKLLKRGPASENAALSSKVLKMISQQEKERIKRNSQRRKKQFFIE